jgi:hypothetical protein
MTVSAQDIVIDDSHCSVVLFSTVVASRILDDATDGSLGDSHGHLLSLAHVSSLTWGSDIGNAYCPICLSRIV